MNTHPDSPSVTTVPAPARIRVWDLPTRVFHWTLVLAFAGAWLSAESERWRGVHVTLGYTVAGLIAFRLFWGVLGTRYARFGSFAFGPRAVFGYLLSILRGAPRHFVGHNPVGSLAVFALLGLGALVTASGWLTYNDVGGEWFEELHEAVASAMLALAGLHVLGVLASGKLHHENLVKSMWSGWKTGNAADGITGMRPAIGALLFAAIGWFWWTAL